MQHPHDKRDGRTCRFHLHGISLVTPVGKGVGGMTPSGKPTRIHDSCHENARTWNATAQRRPAGLRLQSCGGAAGCRLTWEGEAERVHDRRSGPPAQRFGGGIGPVNTTCELNCVIPAFNKSTGESRDSAFWDLLGPLSLSAY